MRVAPPIGLNPEQQDVLEQCAPARSLPARLVQCARIEERGADWDGRSSDQPRAEKFH
jgi:hypothetical protein